MLVFSRVVDTWKVLEVAEIGELVAVSHQSLYTDLTLLLRFVISSLSARLKLLLLDLDEEGSVGVFLSTCRLAEHVVRSEPVKIKCY